jgi:uncharacterized membrane protein YfhO
MPSVFTPIEGWDSGWSVTVDGRSAKVEVVDGGFLGVRLDRGHHRVVFTYRVPGLRAGATVTGATLVIAAGLLLSLLAGRRRTVTAESA